MPETLDKVRSLARDLRKDFPRSPLEPLADYAIAARALDKCRAELMGWQGEYHYDCPVSHIFLDWAEITADDFKAYVATGATDEEVAGWITAQAKKRDRAEILRWSNARREEKVSQLDDRMQAFIEDYVKENLPPESWGHIHSWLGVYDIEEKRIPF